MFGAIKQIAYCLWCVPAIITFLVGLFLWKKASKETHFNAAPVGVDLLKPEGQKVFETTRDRDRKKKKILVWCIVSGVVVYIIALIATSSPVRAMTSARTATPTITETATITLTPQPSSTLFLTGTPDLTATYAPTATERVVYKDRVVNVPGPVQVVTVIVPQQVPVVITQVVTVVVTQVVTATFTPTPTATPTLTWTPTATETP